MMTNKYLFTYYIKTECLQKILLSSRVSYGWTVLLKLVCFRTTTSWPLIQFSVLTRLPKVHIRKAWDKVFKIYIFEYDVIQNGAEIII